MDGPESRPRSSILCRVWSQEGGRKVGEEEREKKHKYIQWNSDIATSNSHGKVTQPTMQSK